MFKNIKIDQVKDYWNSRPCNLKNSNKEIGTMEYFEEVRARKYFVEPHVPVFADYDRWKNKKVLELGCGMGTTAIAFARAGAKVMAVDISEKSLEMAKLQAEISNIEIYFRSGNIEDISTFVPDLGYDLIFSFGVIHHTPKPELVISEIKKYMRPDTELRLMVYNKLSWKVLWILLRYGRGQFWKLNKLVAKYSEAQTGCPVTYTYTKKEIKKLLEGFEIIDLWVDHIFSYDIKEYKQFRYKKVWYFRILPKKVFRWLERHFGWHMCITAKLKQSF